MRILILLWITISSFAQQAPPDTRWIPLAESGAEINGLPWYAENDRGLIRLPVKNAASFRPPVWSLAQSPSGGRIRFRTSSQVVAIRLEYPTPPNMANMHAFGQTGVDLYADGRYIGTATAPKDAGPGKVVERAFFNLSKSARRDREITIYLPLYMSVKVLALGLDSEAKVLAPKPFQLSQPIVFYGTSITQGGCASRSGLSYQAILGRNLNVDFVNLGFSGNGLAEPEMASAIAGLKASCIILDYGQNHRTEEALQKVYAQFLATIREKHPDTPIIAITPIHASHEVLVDPASTEYQKMRDHIRRVVSDRIAHGDKNLQLVEGTDLLGPDQGDGLVDGTHPNDLGFWWMAQGLSARLRKLLDLH